MQNYLVDFKTHKADIAAEEYPALAGVQMGEVRSISYQARDGTAIPAYLTLIPSKPATPGPLVVLPHGGPNARDYPEFDWLAQFLASRGYAVLQPQFRGSRGFGEAFERAGYRQWGGLMQDDVTDGVRAMIVQGIADPHHVCIVGASRYSIQHPVFLEGPHRSSRRSDPQNEIAHQLGKVHSHPHHDRLRNERYSRPD